MIKQNKVKIIIASVIILLPIIAGIILWDKLPDKIATHWGINGEPDGWSPKWFAIIGLPVILFLMQWVCTFAVSLDKNNEKQTQIAFGITIWTLPIISVFGSTYIYTQALGITWWAIDRFIFIFLGALFAIIGNYMPKFSQNRTVGIRVKWTLQSRENWFATHRLAGKMWLVGGIAVMLTSFIPAPYANYTAIGILFVMAIVPIVYSYIYSKIR